MTAVAMRTTSTSTTNTNTGKEFTIRIILFMIITRTTAIRIILIMMAIRIIRTMVITHTTVDTTIHLRITDRIVRNMGTVTATTRMAVITRSQPPESALPNPKWTSREHLRIPRPYLWRASSLAWREMTRC